LFVITSRVSSFLGITDDVNVERKGRTFPVLFTTILGQTTAKGQGV
jgi:hypothetical protein